MIRAIKYALMPALIENELFNIKTYPTQLNLNCC